MYIYQAKQNIEREGVWFSNVNSKGFDKFKPDPHLIYNKTLINLPPKFTTQSDKINFPFLTMAFYGSPHFFYIRVRVTKLAENA